MEISEKNKAAVAQLFQRFQRQALEYVTIFRDGQDTGLRDFSFTRHMKICCGKIEFLLMLEIKQDDASRLFVETTYTSTASKNKEFGPDFFTKNHIPATNFKFYDADKNEVEENKSGSWRSGSLNISLAE